MSIATSLLDSYVGGALAPLAVLILIGGIDDVFLIAVWLASKRRRPVSRAATRLTTTERRIAVFVPLWHEHAVIGGMLDHNVHAIRYSNFDFFVGVYPNDSLTVEAVRQAETKHARVHIALCPHDGPTSKADCLNWAYQRMLLYEETHGVRFEVVVTHDAEDLIHPESLRVINEESEQYAMVQVPVLPLATPLRDAIHGVYIDEFSEYQIKDMPARGLWGGFTPSNGVGTGFRRDALEKLAERSENRIFDPGCLTEDYENGLRIHQLGFRQLFVPIALREGTFMATREYFPRTLNSAIRQRTRWVTGIALQGWQRNGWSGGFRVSYWLWRDRKGLVGSPLSLLTNLIRMYGVTTWVLAQANHTPWGLAEHARHAWLMSATLALPAIQMAFRMGCVKQLYGWKLALGVPLRMPLGNAINAVAVCWALTRYATARIRHRPLCWEKTEHAYPSLEALREHKRKLGEVLVTSLWITQEDLDLALSTQPPGVRLGAHLINLGKLTEEDLYDALSLQQGMPSGWIEVSDVSRQASRSLPREIAGQWKVLPYKILSGSLFLASPEIPSPEMTRDLQAFTQLSLRFQLITPTNFEQLMEVAR